MEEFRFDLNANRPRISNEHLLKALKEFALKRNNTYFSTIVWDRGIDKEAHSSTIISRFGSWRKALKKAGVMGARERNYAPDELVKNLENIWKNLGFPPGKRRLSQYGEKISEQPYKKKWGSVRKACEQVAAYHEGKISYKDLLSGKVSKPSPREVPLKIRYEVLKRDGFRCVVCGQSPATNSSVVLEVDHKKAYAKGGSSDLSNLQTLCQNCNQGKRDRD